MESNLKIKVLGAAAVGFGLVGVIVGTLGFLAGSSSSNLSAEQLAYEAGIRFATPRSAYVTFAKPPLCPDELTLQSLRGKIVLKRKGDIKQDASGAFTCEYTGERSDY